jgi:L-ascorbate metabolism protein UlaG (beta-lactamase superfamily)
LQIQLVRHATLIVEAAGQRLLVDPMLDPAEARDAVPSTPNERRNPLVDLPVPAADIVEGVDAVLVTHLHEDHLDGTAVELLIAAQPPVLCQPPDAGALRERGLIDVRPVDTAVDLPGGLSVARTGGRHGHGELAEMLAPVSGFVVHAPGEPTLYVAGDTVWCDEVSAAIARYEPDVVVVNAGGARFLEGDPITMSPDDVIATADAAAPGRVVAVHMEAINHCVVTRDDLRAAAGERAAIPADGESLAL